MENYVKGEVTELEGDEDKYKNKKKLIKDKRIVVDSIKDHLIPQVFSNKNVTEMFDAFSILFEGRNINIKMNLRNKLKSVKIQNEETIYS